MATPRITIIQYRDPTTGNAPTDDLLKMMNGGSLDEMVDAAELHDYRERMEDQEVLVGRHISTLLDKQFDLYVIEAKQYILAYTWYRAKRQICYLDIFTGPVDPARCADLEQRFRRAYAAP